VVDLLVRRETEQVAQMIAVGAALREAQAGMDAAALRELTKQRRQLTAALTVRARALARSEGLRVTESVAEQVEETLTAAMIDGGAAAAVRSGLLVAPLRATGVDALDAAGAVAVPEALGFEATPVAATLHVVPDASGGGADRGAERLARAQAALADAEDEVAEHRRIHDDAAAAVERLQARSLQVQAELDELRRRLAALEESAQQVDDELADAEEERAEAESELADAVRRRDEAAAKVESGLRPR
jgi:chromosome segregation ATPase